MPQPSSPDVSARPPPWDPLLITRRKITIIDDASLWRRLRGSVSCFFFGRSLPESMLTTRGVAVVSFLVYPPALRTKRASSEVDSFQENPTYLLHPFLQSDQLSLIVSTCSSLFLHPVQKPSIWITSLFLILQPLVWFLTRPCLIPYQTQFFWLMVVAPDGSTSATSRRAESGCRIITESSLYLPVSKKYIQVFTHTYRDIWYH